MCILAIGVECHPDWPLVVVHNRDEEWGRSTDPPQSHDGVIYARDAVAGGTWMGLNSTSGAFAALTNVRSSAPRPAGGPSRGALVLHALERPGDETAAVAGQYSTFSLWHGSAFPGGSAQVTRSRFRARPEVSASEEDAAAETATPQVTDATRRPAPSGGAWEASTDAVAPGEVAAHSNEGDARCGDAPWAKTRRLRTGVAGLLSALPTGCGAKTLRGELAALASESLDDGALAYLLAGAGAAAGGVGGYGVAGGGAGRGGAGGAGGG